MHMSKHAAQRCQQRSISETLIDLIIQFGECGRHQGANVYYMTKRTRQALEKEVGLCEHRHASKKLNTYVVVSNDGVVITAAKRIKRLKF
jgi:hypothetical protein